MWRLTTRLVRYDVGAYHYDVCYASPPMFHAYQWSWLQLHIYWYSPSWWLVFNYVIINILLGTCWIEVYSDFRSLSVFELLHLINIFLNYHGNFCCNFVYKCLIPLSPNHQLLFLYHQCFLVQVFNFLLLLALGTIFVIRFFRIYMYMFYMTQLNSFLLNCDIFGHVALDVK